MKRPHVFRWDMDKTYLRTEFDGIRALLKTAVQGSADKENVPGSAELLRSLRNDSGGQVQIYFISGSPRQMRRVLSNKLRLDGIHYDGFILKDNLRNLLKGRFRAIKEQVGYKLPALLKARSTTDANMGETLVGDDAERDGFIYSLYADLLAQRVSKDELNQVLDIAQVYPDGRERIWQAWDQGHASDPVERILIHLDRHSPPQRFQGYGGRLVPVYNYFQAAHILYEDQHLMTASVAHISSVFLEQLGFQANRLERNLLDLVKRRALKLETLVQLHEESDRRHPLHRILEQVLTAARRMPSRKALEIKTPHYPSLLRKELQLKRMEKRQRRRFF